MKSYTIWGAVNQNNSSYLTLPADEQARHLKETKNIKANQLENSKDNLPMLMFMGASENWIQGADYLDTRVT